MLTFVALCRREDSILLAKVAICRRFAQVLAYEFRGEGRLCDLGELLGRIGSAVGADWKNL